MTTEAADTPTAPNPSGATRAAVIACPEARQRMHSLVCDIGSVADVARGLADLLEEAADTAADTAVEACAPSPTRALVRLARALQSDASEAHRALDHLWLDTSPMRRAKATVAEAGE